MGDHELNEGKSAMQGVAWRGPSEWKKGHVRGARRIFVSELSKRMAELDRSKSTVVYCGSGYRSSIAASILKPAGFKELWNVPASCEAWKKAKLPPFPTAGNEIGTAHASTPVTLKPRMPSSSSQ